MKPLLLFTFSSILFYFYYFTGVYLELCRIGEGVWDFYCLAYFYITIGRFFIIYYYYSCYWVFYLFGVEEGIDGWGGLFLDSMKSLNLNDF